MLKQKKYAFNPEYCDVLLSWVEAVESDEQQKIYEASQVLLPVLSELIRDQHTFKAKPKLGRGRVKADPKHEAKYAYAKRYGDKAAAEKFGLSEEAMRQSRLKVKKKYSQDKLEIIECLKLMEIYMDEIKIEHMTNQEINEKLSECRILEERLNSLLSSA